MEMTEAKPLYIGDGVYIYNDGYHLVLKTGEGDFVQEVFLDSHVRYQLYEIFKSEFERKGE